jgi:hypothetical protein
LSVLLTLAICRSSSLQPEVVIPTTESLAARASTLAEEGKKAMALGEWEGAVEKYADALEIMYVFAFAWGMSC